MASIVRPRCYVASPLGFNDAGRYYYREVLLPALEPVVEPVDPWVLTTSTEINNARAAGRLREAMLKIGRRNVRAINECDLLTAILEGQESDSGTAAELGYAMARGKRCFGLRSDFRQAGEEGVAVNLQVETFILDSGGMIVTTLPDLVTALRRFVDSEWRVRGDVA